MKSVLISEITRLSLMFGTLRLLLAFLVLLSHLDYRIAGIPGTGFQFRPDAEDSGFNPGPFAVAIFYMLSGFVMTGLVRAYYMDLKKFGLFLVDRCCRIFPQYLVFMFLMVPIVLTCDQGHMRTVDGDPTVLRMLYNITLIPLNFLMYIEDVANFTLIEPAWSLGAEMQFYLVIPLILIWRARDWVVPVSMAIFFLGSMWFFNMNADVWAYRLLPGVLFIFLAGSYAFDVNKGLTSAKVKLGLVYVGVLGLFALMAAYSLYKGEGIDEKWSLGKNYEVYFAFLIGVPLTLWLATKKRQDWDEYLGNLSYGLFLSHMLAIWGLAKWSIGETTLDQTPWFTPIVIVASFAMAAAGYHLIEKPVLAFRRRFRQRKIAPAGPPAR